MTTPPPIIIVGCRRSGTTLLRRMLAQHPDLQVHPAEPQFFLELYNLFGLSLPNGAAAVQHILQHPYKSPLVDAGNFSAPSAPVPLAALSTLYMAAWMGDSTRRPVLKHPALVYHLDLVNRLFPEGIILQVVRDPRANVSSQRSRWPQFSVWHAAMLWRQAITAGQEWAGWFPSRYLEVQYESLVLNPEPTMQTLCRQLSIPYLEQLLTINQEETIWDPGSGPKKKHFSKPDPSRINLWQQRLSSADIRLIEYCCHSQMTGWNYQPLYNPSLSCRLRLRQMSESFHFQFHALGRRFKSSLRRMSRHFAYR